MSIAVNPGKRRTPIRVGADAVLLVRSGKTEFYKRDLTGYVCGTVASTCLCNCQAPKEDFGEEFKREHG